MPPSHDDQDQIETEPGGEPVKRRETRHAYRPKARPRNQCGREPKDNDHQDNHRPQRQTALTSYECSYRLLVDKEPAGASAQRGAPTVLSRCCGSRVQDDSSLRRCSVFGHSTYRAANADRNGRKNRRETGTETSPTVAVVRPSVLTSSLIRAARTRYPRWVRTNPSEPHWVSSSDKVCRIKCEPSAV